MSRYKIIRIAGHNLRVHRLIAAARLGKALPKGAVVHHHNNNGKDNSPGNLVICNDNSYHLILHRRAAAIVACGRAHWRCCEFCYCYDDPIGMAHIGRHAYHKDCKNADARQRNCNKNQLVQFATQFDQLLVNDPTAAKRLQSIFNINLDEEAV